MPNADSCINELKHFARSISHDIETITRCYMGGFDSECSLLFRAPLSLSINCSGAGRGRRLETAIEQSVLSISKVAPNACPTQSKGNNGENNYQRGAKQCDATRHDATWCDAWPPKRKFEPQMNLSPFRQQIQIQIQLPQQIHWQLADGAGSGLDHVVAMC